MSTLEKIGCFSQNGLQHRVAFIHQLDRNCACEGDGMLSERSKGFYDSTLGNLQCPPNLNNMLSSPSDVRVLVDTTELVDGVVQTGGRLMCSDLMSAISRKAIGAEQ